MPKVTDLRVNGKAFRLDVDSSKSLLHVLREDLDLTGAKYGCGEGQCGACTVLSDGRPIRSCMTPVGTVGGKGITTIEGLEQDGKLHPVQQAFLDAGAFQCGYCTSGMILSAAGLLRQQPHPSEEEIIRFMHGNICRCGTYGRIIAAIHDAADKLK